MMATAMADAIAPDTVTWLHIEPGGLDYYLKAVGDGGGNPRLQCFDGRIKLVSPSGAHERSGECLDTLIKAICSVLRIRLAPYHSFLYRKSKKDVGVEPDRSYYVQHAATVHGRTELDMAVDPPPDLVVEIVVWHSAKHALAVCRELRVPEVWVYDVPKRELIFKHLVRSSGDSCAYRAGKKSLAFSFLTLEDVSTWLESADDYVVLDRKIRKWVRTVLKPRFEARGDG